MTKKRQLEIFLLSVYYRIIIYLYFQSYNLTRISPLFMAVAISPKMSNFHYIILGKGKMGKESLKFKKTFMPKGSNARILSSCLDKS